MDQPHKAHRPSKRSDASAKKVERHNPKAFTFSGGGVAVHRKVQRSAEITQKRLKVQTAPDKTSDNNPPPYVVVVHGPSGCGKSTLIKCLVKHYSKQSVANLKGAPITCVASKSRRLTLIECPSDDLAAMLDLSKIADLAVCMIDSRRGIELDTLEFISLMRNHGMPRVMGILSHLDAIGQTADVCASKDSLVKHSRTIKKLKKKLKSRFWAELYTGAKLFFLSGMKSRKYLPRDVINLARYISTQRFDPLVWRAQHPHLLMLAMEIDNPTAEELAEETRTIAVSGYVKGSPARDNYVYHIPGCGDFKITEIFTPQDPCPLPTNRALQLRKQTDAVRQLYAPLCDVGRLAIEGDAIYVNISESKKIAPAPSKHTKVEDAEEQVQLSESESGQSDEDEDDISQEAAECDASDGEPSDVSTDTCGSDSESRPDFWNLETLQTGSVWDEEVALTENTGDSKVGNVDLTQVTFAEAAKDIEEYDQLHPRKADDGTEDWSAIIYSGTRDNEESWELFMSNGHSRTDASHVLSGESYKCIDHWEGAKPADSFLMAPLQQLILYSQGLEAGSDDEDLDKTPVRYSLFSDPEHPINAAVLQALKRVCFATGGWDSGLSEREAELLEGERSDVAKMSVEIDSSRTVWTIPVGTFVRLKLVGVKKSWLDENFKLDARPVIIGGVREEENRAVFLQGRCRRHRWSPGILKSTEPLLFSVGWRRFQSLPYFAIEDRGSVRNRYLKYTPEHMHCQAYFHGIAVPPGTGVVAIRHMDRKLPRSAEVDSAEKLLDEISSYRPLGKEDSYEGWRISLTGTITEITADQPRVMKKIKFIGSVMSEKVKSTGHTVYITGMFNSFAEVSRCIGVPIQTQAGIRGLVKKPHGDQGDFRATFEAPIRPNDVIICKAWFRVPMEPFCNPQMDLSSWDFLRTFGEIRRELGLRVDASRPDSVYKAVEIRSEPKDRRPRIPARLRKALPFESLKIKEHVEVSRSDATDQIEFTLKEKPKETVHYTPYETMVNALLKQVDLKKSGRIAHEAATLAKRVAEHNRLSEIKQAVAAEKRKETTRAAARRKGLREKTHRKKMRLED